MHLSLSLYIYIYIYTYIVIEPVAISSIVSTISYRLYAYMYSIAYYC